MSHDEVRPRRGTIDGIAVTYVPVENLPGTFRPMDEMTGLPMAAQPGTRVTVDVLGPGQSIAFPVPFGGDPGGPWCSYDTDDVVFE